MYAKVMGLIHINWPVLYVYIGKYRHITERLIYSVDMPQYTTWSNKSDYFLMQSDFIEAMTFILHKKIVHAEVFSPKTLQYI